MAFSVSVEEQSLRCLRMLLGRLPPAIAMILWVGGLELAHLAFCAQLFPLVSLPQHCWHYVRVRRRWQVEGLLSRWRRRPKTFVSCCVCVFASALP